MAVVGSAHAFERCFAVDDIQDADEVRSAGLMRRPVPLPKTLFGTSKTPEILTDELREVHLGLISC